VRDQPGGGERRPGLPVQREGVGMRGRGGAAYKPLTVQLDSASGAPNECTVAGDDREGTGLLVGERL
jgi:hypothetical protein